jgi:predicted GNAT family N-acyltransferase
VDVISVLTADQIVQLKDLFQNEWWTKDRQLEDIQTMLLHSDIVVGLCDSDTKELIGFTRVLTDYTYKALILDVIVKESHRGKDLGKAILYRIVEHPNLQNVSHFELYCRPEMVPFYEKWGFTSNLKNLIFMRKY